MASLTDLVTSRMTPEVMQKLAGLAGISSTNAKRAIDAIIPTQLYDLVSMGATEAGANRLLSLLNEQVLEVVEEELEVGTRQVERGRVRIYSKTSEREVERQVSLRDETIRVQRRPVSREVSISDPDLFKERSYEITEVDEEAVVNIRARVIEEVVIGKEVAEKIETIHQTLCRTDVEVEEVPGVRRFDDYAGDFRSYYTQRLAKSGLGYEKYSPAFRFGHSLAANEPFRSQSWETIEPDVRRLWEEKNPGTREQLKDAIHHTAGGEKRRRALWKAEELNPIGTSLTSAVK